eukprot:scaffold12160_cov60-Phaeocystis_antarctica.AAC.10
MVARERRVAREAASSAGVYCTERAEYIRRSQWAWVLKAASFAWGLDNGRDHESSVCTEKPTTHGDSYGIYTRLTVSVDHLRVVEERHRHRPLAMPPSPLPPPPRSVLPPPPPPPRR